MGVLVHTGVYRDENICEPAMAPFIQRRVGANPALPPLGAPGTFSFDLVNGGCGFLSAVDRGCWKARDPSSPATL